MASSSRRCANHPETAAVELCSRCGSFVCGECLEYTKAEPPVPLCTACARRELALRGPGRARVALALGLLGLVTFCVPLGAVAFALAQLELRAIGRGEVREQVRPLARAARVVGVLAVAAFVLGLAAGAAYFVGRPLGGAPPP